MTSLATAKFPAPLPLQPEEREILLPRPRRTVAQWAAEKRVLSAKTTDLYGAWSHEYTPYLVEIMDCLSDIATRQVTVMKCSQSGGTEAGLNFLGWCVDESPAPMIVVMPREDDANRRAATRIKPLFESTPTLRGHLPRGSVDEINTGKETIFDHMILYLAWAGSAAALADNPVCNVILDEVGKFPAASGQEADPVSLAKKRQRTFYYRSKLLVLSTPVVEGDLIDREYRRGDQRELWVLCVHCRKRHVPAWVYVSLDKTEKNELLDPQDYESGARARYICPLCGSGWSERDRWQAVTAGVWAPAGCQVEESGVIRPEPKNAAHKSYHITALMLHPRFQTVGGLAAEWAAAQLDRKAGDRGPLQDFINSQLAEPWKEVSKSPDIERLRGHVGTYPAGIVPEGVQILTAGIDVQMDHLYVRLLGWGYLSEVWSIFETRLETGDTARIQNYGPLLDFLLTSWPMAATAGRKDGPRMRIWKAAIDCGHNMDTVIDFCRKCTQVPLVPVRGDGAIRKQVYIARKIAGGSLIRYDLNVDAIKDRLHRLYYADTPGPGYFHFHGETRQETLEHLTSEELRPIRAGRNAAMTWTLKKQHLPNHYFDCDVYADFAAELAGARFLRDPEVSHESRVRRTGVMEQFKR